MDINSGNTGSEPGKHMSLLVGDTIYFDAGAAGGRELWAHNISNQSTWRVVDIHTGSIGSNPGDRMALLVGDTIYFDADDGSTGVNCGRTTPQTTPLGEWPTSVQPAVPLEIT